MPRPRKELVCVEDTPYYHVTSRCVRRTYLCGFDRSTGQSYEHRRQWIEDRIRILSSIFAMDICSYAVMNNHYHIVLKICPEEAFEWSNEEVIQRWTSLFKGKPLIQKWKKGLPLLPAELEVVSTCIARYRKRLSRLGWFMKCLNEPIARQANGEDNCTGHFWESRYKSQALLTEEALLSCMAYVDLNPVRAAMATTPEASDHTSIKQRLKPNFDLKTAIQEQTGNHALMSFELPIKPLAKFEGDVSHKIQSGILFSLKDYLELVDATGRIIRDDKRGVISGQLPPILKRLGLDKDEWMTNATKFEEIYYQKFHRRRDFMEKPA